MHSDRVCENDSLFDYETLRTLGCNAGETVPVTVSIGAVDAQSGVTIAAQVGLAGPRSYRYLAAIFFSSACMSRDSTSCGIG